MDIRIGEMGDGFFLQLKFYAEDLITKTSTSEWKKMAHFKIHDKN